MIHITSVLEWSVAIILIQSIGLNELAIAMLPALISAMAACTWHLFDNSNELRSLVTIQAIFTLIGNCCLAYAAWRLDQSKQIHDNHGN